MDVSKMIFRLSGIPIHDAELKLKEILAQNEIQTQQQIKERKQILLQQLIQNNRFYQSKVNDLATTWESLPILQKSDYQSDLKSLISSHLAPSELYYSSTSGSSGHPFHFAKSKNSHALAWSIARKLYAHQGIGPGAMQARFYGIPKETVGYYKEKLKDFLLNRRRFPVFDLSDQALSDFVRRFQQKPFEYLYGYANSLLLFAEYLIRNNIVLVTLCPTLHNVITTSEMCTDADRMVMQKAFGIKIINEYGSSETGIMAFEDHDGDWVLNTINQYFEVVDEEGHIVPEGEEGNILVTDLYNDAFPFIRYQIGDRGAIFSKEKNGKKIQILKKLAGRINDTIVLPSGKKAAGLTFYYVSRGILNSSGTIKEFIIRQKKTDTFYFEVVCDDELTHEQTSEIKQKLITYLEPGINLIINRVNAIERPANGKRKHFISEL